MESTVDAINDSKSLRLIVGWTATRFSCKEKFSIGAVPYTKYNTDIASSDGNKRDEAGHYKHHSDVRSSIERCCKQIEYASHEI